MQYLVTINGDDDVVFEYKGREFSRVEILIREDDFTTQMCKMLDLLTDVRILYGSHTEEMEDILRDFSRFLGCVSSPAEFLSYHLGGNRYISVDVPTFTITI